MAKKKCPKCGHKLTLLKKLWNLKGEYKQPIRCKRCGYESHLTNMEWF